MSPYRYQLGDLVYSCEDLFNDDDGGIPDVEPGALLTTAGARGVIIQIGHAEAQPETTIYLVRFEGPDQELGPPVGCLPEELTQEQPSPMDQPNLNMTPKPPRG